MCLADNVLLLVLCDGMGGTSGGNVASGLAARTAVIAANRAVYNRARESSELANMGTTLVSSLIVDDRVYIANVGDSRMYMYSEGEFSQVTHDHSYVQMLVDMGMITREEALSNPRRNILTRAVGTEKSIDVDITQMELPKKDGYFILCSDGLYNFLREDEMVKILTEPLDEIDDDDYDADLTMRTDMMIDTANFNGGGDNITTILVRFPELEN